MILSDILAYILCASSVWIYCSTLFYQIIYSLNCPLFPFVLNKKKSRLCSTKFEHGFACGSQIPVQRWYSWRNGCKNKQISMILKEIFVEYYCLRNRYFSLFCWLDLCFRCKICILVYTHEYRFFLRVHIRTLYLIRHACTTTVAACYWKPELVFGWSLFPAPYWRQPHSLAGVGHAIEVCCTPSRTKSATSENKINFLLTVYSVLVDLSLLCFLFSRIIMQYV
jgi:hypothetical protein